VAGRRPFRIYCGPNSIAGDKTDHLAWVTPKSLAAISKKTIYFGEVLIFSLHIFFDEDKFHTIVT
jgi:hypothetical protein